MILIRSSLSATRIKCETPNICVIDVRVERTIRLIGIYALMSKSWDWNILSQYRTNQCGLLGDFNININSDTDKINTKKLLNWSKSLLLTPIVPNETISP